MLPSLRFAHVPGVLLAVALLAGPARAATPADELLRLVPEDVGFCLVVHDLRGHADAVGKSPFARQFKASPLGAALAASPEMAKLEAAEQFLQQHLNLDWARLRDDLLGDAVVFAYRPGPPGRTDKDEQGLMLLHVRDPRLLADLVNRLNRIQKEAGDVKEVEEREHKGVKYVRRAEKTHDSFYYLKGPILAFSSQEAVLRQALDLERQASADEPPIARQLRLLGADKKLLSLWINPRAFLPELEWKITHGKPDEAALLSAFAGYWKALDGIALWAAVDRDLETALAVRARPDALPLPARRFFAEAAKPSELWRHFPDNALVAGAVRLDLPALVELVSEFLPEDARRAARDGLERTVGAMLGKDFFKDVLTCLGPDLGFCVVAPAAGDKDWFPQGVVAFRVRPGEGNVDQSLLSAVNSFAVLAVLGYNRKGADAMSLRSVWHDKVEIKYLANDQRFPPGFQPAFALTGGYLVFGTSPEAIRRFGTATAPAAASADVPLWRLSVKELRRFLQERRTPLVALIAENNQITKDEAGRRLDGLLPFLQLVDRVELRQRAAAGQVTLTLRVQSAQPLK